MRHEAVPHVARHFAAGRRHPRQASLAFFCALGLGVSVAGGLASLSGCPGMSDEEVLAGKHCGPAGDCLAGYVCDTRLNLCVPAGTPFGGSGGTSVGGFGGSGATTTTTGGSTATGGTGTGGSPTGGTGTGGSTATGGTGTGGSPTGGSGGEGGVGGSPVEVLCLNGIDDDDDSATDCDDPDCVDVQCVPAYAGATGYAFQVAAPADCVAGSTATSFDDCGPCSCTANPSCSMLISFYLDDACTNLYVAKDFASCYNVGPGTQNRWIIATTTPTGSCQAPANYPPAAAHSCVADQVGHCDGNNVCVPTNPNAQRTCVLVAGAVTCAAPYVEGRRVYDPSLDSCACTCSGQGEGCSVGDITVYHDTDWCGGGSTTSVPFDGTCQAGGWTRSYSIPDVTPQLTCAGEPGPATQVTEHTLCCLLQPPQ